MYSDRLLIWSVRGLNGRARHDVVADYVLQERVCLRETKLTVIDDSLIVNILGSSFAYSYLSAVGIRGILVAWQVVLLSRGKTLHDNFRTVQLSAR
jgi:hypothetical protein